MSIVIGETRPDVYSEGFPDPRAGKIRRAFENMRNCGAQFQMAPVLSTIIRLLPQ